MTLLAQVAFAGLSLLTYRLLAQETGTDGFASYALVKQAVAIVFPVVTVGLVGGLPRYLALPPEARTPSSESYLLAGVAICGCVTSLAAILSLLGEDLTASLFFGSESRTDLVLPFVAFLGASAIFQLAYGYNRGLMRVRTAAALQVGAYALPPPLIVLALAGEPIDVLILAAAAALALISLAAVTGPLARSLLLPRRRGFERAGASLWNYGHRRVPGELAQLGLFVLVPIVAAHAGTLTDVAYLTAGQQVLSVLSVAVLPLGLVLLPSLARLWENDRERARDYVGQLTAFAAHVAIFLSAQTILYADIAVRVWLGSGFDDAGSVVRITVAPAALFVVYLMLRSTLDAVEVRSFNSRNNIIALAVFALVAALLLAFDVADAAHSVAWAFCAGLTTQGVLTFLTVHGLFKLAPSEYRLEVAIPLGAITAAAGFAARPLIDGSGAELALLLALEIVLAVIYFGALVRARPGWLILLRERFFQAG